MTSLTGAEPAHPLEVMLDALESATAVGVDAPAWTLTPEQLTRLLPRLVVVERQVAATRLAMLREADRHQVGDPLGFAHTVGWWSQVTRSTKPQARRDLTLAARLDAEEHHPVRAAVLAGTVSVDQAAVIMRAVDDLPADLVDASLRAQAETDLVALAEHHDPRELRILGRRILEASAPEIADQALARQVEAEEVHAEATSYFRMNPDGHGSMIGTFKVPLLAGRILEKHLEAIAAPKHQNATAALDPTGAKIPQPWRLGVAFTEYLATRPGTSIPRTGGIPATLVVTMTLETLLSGLKAAEILDTGDAVSAGQARKLAEQALIIPAVLGGDSEVLDLGRARRLHTPAQRLAIALRDKTCIVQHCDRGPTHAHFHHLDPWAQGGPTSVERGVMICPPHHTQIHNPRYGYDTQPDGKIQFYRRT